LELKDVKLFTNFKRKHYMTNILGIGEIRYGYRFSY
jgi:hypothetical protein